MNSNVILNWYIINEPLLDPEVVLLEWGDVGSPHGNSFHGAYFGAETGGGPGIRRDPVGIRWKQFPVVFA